MRYFTNSEIQCYKECKRKWWLAYYRRLRLRARSVTGVASIGTRVHEALAEWYVPDGQERKDPRVAVEELITKDREVLMATLTSVPDSGWTSVPELSLDLKDFESEAELTRIMIDGYMQWLEETGADAEYRVIGSERAVEYEFAPGLSIAGREDVAVERYHDGVRLGMDHKTGDFAALRKTLPQSEQTLLYEILRRVTNPDVHVEGMVYNMLRRVRRTASAKPPFYDRITVTLNQHQIASAWQRFMGVINDIRETERRLEMGESHLTAAYPRPNNDCSWKCEFYICCSMFDDGSRVDAMIETYYEIGDPLERYPELTGGSE